MPNQTTAKPIGSTALVAGALRDAIGSGAIPPGAPLKQDDIAAQYSVSPTPVREALKILVSEGLATLYHNRGCFVSDLSSTVARELTEFRAALEPKLAGWALDHLRGHDLDQARLIMEQIDSAADPMERLRLAAAFHTVIYERAGRPFFLEQISRAGTISTAIGGWPGPTPRFRSKPKASIDAYWSFASRVIARVWSPSSSSTSSIPERWCCSIWSDWKPPSLPLVEIR